MSLEEGGGDDYTAPLTFIAIYLCIFYERQYYHILFSNEEISMKKVWQYWRNMKLMTKKLTLYYLFNIISMHINCVFYDIFYERSVKKRRLCVKGQRKWPVWRRYWEKWYLAILPVREEEEDEEKRSLTSFSVFLSKSPHRLQPLTATPYHTTSASTTASTHIISYNLSNYPYYWREMTCILILTHYFP